jgi:hypothetical protein
MYKRLFAVLGLAVMVSAAAGGRGAYAQDPPAPRPQEPPAPVVDVPVPPSGRGRDPRAGRHPACAGRPRADAGTAGARHARDASRGHPSTCAGRGRGAARTRAAAAADSPPLVRFIQLMFPTQGDVSVIEPQTYLYYIQTQPSRPSDGVWVPFDEDTVLEDFKRLWGTNFLDDLWIEVKDAPYDNGVVGKHIIFNMEERRRVKIVDYVGTKKVDQSKIEEKLKEENIHDPHRLVRRPGGRPAGGGRHPRAARREGPPVRHRAARDEGPAGRAQAGAPELRRRRGSACAHPADRLRRQQGREQPVAAAADEGQQAAVVPVVPERARRLPGGEVRGRRRADRGALPQQGLHRRPCRTARAEVPGGLARRRTRFVQLRVPITEGERYRVGELHVRRQRRRQGRGAASALQAR